MADQAKSTEAEIAIYLGSTIASSLIGGAADQLITSPILSLVGITKSDDTVARYFQEISNQLTNLGQSLDDQMRGLQDSLSQIKTISSEVKDYLTHEGLAQILREFNTNANTIKIHFESFVNDVSALGDVVGATQGSDPATDLYKNVLTSENAQKVSEAMSRIHDLLVEASGFDKTILDYLLNMITSSIQKYAETDDNYRHAFKLEHKNWRQLPRNFDYYDCAKIVINGHDKARAELPKIGSLFKRIVATQLKGLIFLSKAWQESPQKASLGARTNEVIEGINLMKSFYPAYKAAVETAIAGSLKTSGKRLTADFLHQFKSVTRGSDIVWGNQKDPGGFLNDQWIMMKVLETEKTAEWPDPIDRIYMVYQPWTNASKLPAGSDRYCVVGIHGWEDKQSFGGVPMSPLFPEITDVAGVVFGERRVFDFHTFDSAILNGLNALPSDPPEEYTSVLRGLPGSVDDALGTHLSSMLDKSAVGMALSFKCALDGDALWLQGNPAKGEVRLAPRRSSDSTRSTAWGVYSSQTGDVRFEKLQLSCLGFEHASRHYLNEKDNPELAAPPLGELIKLGGADWGFGPADFNDPTGLQNSNAVVIFSMRDDRRLKGHADGSVSLVPWTENPNTNPGLLWRVYPYTVDPVN